MPLKILALLLISASAFAQSLTITTPSRLPAGFVGTPYSATLQASGGTAPYTWAWIACSGACNTGLGFDPPALSNTSSDGILGGTPANAGTSTFTFQVKDATGATASKSFSIVVSPSQPTYKFSCPGTISGTISIDSTGKATVTTSSITLNSGCAATKQ